MGGVGVVYLDVLLSCLLNHKVPHWLLYFLEYRGFSPASTQLKYILSNYVFESVFSKSNDSCVRTLKKHKDKLKIICITFHKSLDLSNVVGFFFSLLSGSGKMAVLIRTLFAVFLPCRISYKVTGNPHTSES